MLERKFNHHWLVAKCRLIRKVFADSFPEPVVLKSQLELGVMVRTCPLRDVIPDIEEFKKRKADNLVFFSHGAGKG